MIARRDVHLNGSFAITPESATPDVAEHFYDIMIFDEEDNVVRVGGAHVLHFRTGQASYEYLWEQADGAAAVAPGYVEAVIDPDTDFFRPGIGDIEAVKVHFAALHRLEVDPQWRGRGIGGHALRLLTGHYADTDACMILKPFPPDAHELSGEEMMAQVTRLQRFYARAGFTPWRLSMMVHAPAE